MHGFQDELFQKECHIILEKNGWNCNMYFMFRGINYSPQDYTGAHGIKILRQNICWPRQSSSSIPVTNYLSPSLVSNSPNNDVFVALFPRSTIQHGGVIKRLDVKEADISWDRWQWRWLFALRKIVYLSKNKPNNWITLFSFSKRLFNRLFQLIYRWVILLEFWTIPILKSSYIDVTDIQNWLVFFVLLEAIFPSHIIEGILNTYTE